MERLAAILMNLISTLSTAEHKYYWYEDQVI